MLKNNKGFSLIELVVVMAIVGVLMMVGVPQVQNYIAKAKRTEMRTNLAQLYAAEKSFHAEYSTYLADLVVVGFQPEGTLNYQYGFTSATGAQVPTQLGGGNADSGQLSTADICPDLANRNDAANATASCFNSPSAINADPGAGTYSATATRFLAYASGAIADPTVSDVWQIDNRKLFQHLHDGVSDEAGPDSSAATSL